MPILTYWNSWQRASHGKDIRSNYANWYSSNRFSRSGYGRCEAGSVVYIAGAGPVGLACASSCQLLGAAIVIVGDLNEERLAHARSFGCETINLTNGIPVQEQIAMIVGIPEVDCFVDCVGFEPAGTVRCRRRKKAGCCFKSSHGNY
jgi:threonine dehydrogenase-like Zn-dependent dehydrogenase